MGGLGLLASQSGKLSPVGEQTLMTAAKFPNPAWKPVAQPEAQRLVDWAQGSGAGGGARTPAHRQGAAAFGIWEGVLGSPRGVGDPGPF